MNQDWDKVVLTKKRGGGGGGDGGPSRSAAQPGDKKFAAGSNTGNRNTGSMVKLDNETEALSHKKVGVALGKAIQQGRMQRGLTQAKLAQSINEKPAVINQYENGKAIPNGQIIAKIERQLNVKLPRPSKK